MRTPAYKVTQEQGDEFKRELPFFGGPVKKIFAPLFENVTNS